MVNEGVEGAVGTESQQTVALVFVRLAGLESGDEGRQGAVMHSDHVVGTDEEIDFAGAGDFLAGVPEREVQDEEEVVIVLIQLGTFFGAADVFQVERVDARVAVVQRFDIGGAGMDDVNPGEVVVDDESGGHGRIIA